MQDYEKEFLDFAIGHDVIRFGQFTLKSGRLSPYFFNAGLFNTGAMLARIGEYYAAAILDSGIEFDMLYGPAYKGIPLAAATAIALANNHDRDVPFAFNRKEAKQHAEGGIIVGAPLEGRVMIIDDVISAGLSIGEAVNVIRGMDARVAGVVIALDRQERGAGKLAAVKEVEEKFNIQVANIVSLKTLETYLEQKGGQEEHLAAIREYRQEYGG
ncbi:MAG: orotate phosphoribosyltransferase [Gammaproteobacteria bacterium]|nr:orotate phosphoribosyltransferase [Gammaproteobacteria bacterium]